MLHLLEPTQSSQLVKLLLKSIVISAVETVAAVRTALVRVARQHTLVSEL